MSKLLKQKVIIDEDQFPLTETANTVKDETPGNTVTKGGVAVAVSDDQIEKIAEKVIDEKVEEKLQEKLREKELATHVEEEAEVKKIATVKKVEDIIHNPSRTLFSAKSVFPFDLFPDEIRIEESKVNIISRNFFASAQVQTQSYKDIKKVEIETSIFFAKLRLISWTPVDSTLEIDFLKREEALKARRIIEGLKTLTEKNIDFQQIPTHDLLDKVEELGSVK